MMNTGSETHLLKKLVNNKTTYDWLILQMNHQQLYVLSSFIVTLLNYCSPYKAKLQQLILQMN